MLAKTNSGARTTLWESFQITPTLPHNTRKVGEWHLLPRHQHLPSSSRDPQANHSITSPNTIIPVPTNTGEERSDYRTTATHSTTTGASQDIHSIDQEEKVMSYGVMKAPSSDPVMRRLNLTGLHLRCTTIHVSPFPLCHLDNWHSPGTVGSKKKKNSFLYPLLVNYLISSLTDILISPVCQILFRHCTLRRSVYDSHPYQALRERKRTREMVGGGRGGAYLKLIF